MQLHWYYRYWIQTTKHIDYGITKVIDKDGTALVELQRIGEFPMPIDLLVTHKDGSKELFYIPLNEQMGSKPIEDKSIKRIDVEAWPWVNPTYTLSVGRKASEIETIEIDPSGRMADIDQKNNTLKIEDSKPYSTPVK
jgi:hypothetical protein